MKTLLGLLMATHLLFAGLPFNLENLTQMRLYIVNESEFIDTAKEEAIRAHVFKRLSDKGFVFGKRDSSTFFVKIESLHVNDSDIINTQIGVGEQSEVQRGKTIQTFAFTYYANDLIESQAPYSDMMDSLNFLIDEFLAQYEEDR